MTVGADVLPSVVGRSVLFVLGGSPITVGVDVLPPFVGTSVPFVGVSTITEGDGVTDIVGTSVPPGGAVVFCNEGLVVCPSICVPVTFIVSRFSRFRTSIGMAPVRPALNCTSSISKFNKSPNSVGIVPVKKFVPNNIAVNDTTDPNSVGRVPSMKLVSRLKISVNMKQIEGS